MDEYSISPLHLEVLQHLMDDIVPTWCDQNLPSTSLVKVPLLLHAFTVALDTSEADLHLQVQRVLLGDSTKAQVAFQTWLQDTGIKRTHYLSQVSNMGTNVDGLFIWIAVQCLGVHLNLIHANGIWTTCCSSIPGLRDPVVVFALGYFLASPEANLASSAGCDDLKSKSAQGVFLPSHGGL